MDMSVHGIDDFDEFGYYNYLNVQPVLPTHAHPGMIEICFMIKGSQTYFVGNEKYDVKGGDIFLRRNWAYLRRNIWSERKSAGLNGCL